MKLYYFETPHPRIACAVAKHTDAPDWASRSHVVVLVRVFTQRILGRTDKVDVDQGHNLAGACLVRLTRTLIVILYAQPKTPIDFLRYSMQPRQNRETWVRRRLACLCVLLPVVY